MIYLIGGPGRAGKTTLAQQLLKQHGIPYFSTDYLMMGLSKGYACLGVNPSNSDEEVAVAMQPVLHPLITAMAENGERYCVEGIAVTPTLVGDLVDQFATGVISCFLGYCDITVEEKLRQEKLATSANPWLQTLEESSQQRIVRQGIEYSTRLRKKCFEKGYLFNDTGADFNRVINKAETQLTNVSPLRSPV